MKHLWEIEHRYYCNEQNYRANFVDNPSFEYESFDDFLAEWSHKSVGLPLQDYMDLNLLFRWDWEAATNDYDNDLNVLSKWSDDDNERDGILRLFWMMQRKGDYRSCEIKVCRNDEPQIIKYLKPRLKHLQDLWAPLS